MIKLKLKLQININFFNIHRFVAAVANDNNIPCHLDWWPFPRILKSHSTFHEAYKQVIYLVRDPRSVMVSYFYYCRALHGYGGTIDDFVRDPRFGVRAWIQHVNGWLERTRPSTRFFLIRYEDLRQMPRRKISELADLFGVSLTEREIDEILDETSFNRMRELEIRTGSLSMRRGGFRFVRSGHVGPGHELTDDARSYIENAARSAMAVLGYS